MTNLTFHPDTPSRRPPATATLSAPAVDAVPTQTTRLTTSRLMTTRLKT